MIDYDWNWNNYCFKINSTNDYLHFKICIYRILPSNISLFMISSFYSIYMNFINFLSMMLLILYYLLQIILLLPQSMKQPVKLPKITLDIYVRISKVTISLNQIQLKTLIIWDKSVDILPKMFEILLSFDCIIDMDGIQCHLKSLTMSCHCMVNKKRFLANIFSYVMNNIISQRNSIHRNIENHQEHYIDNHQSLFMISSIIIHSDKIVIKCIPEAISASLYVFIKQFINDFNDNLIIDTTTNTLIITENCTTKLTNYFNYIRKFFINILKFFINLNNIINLKLTIDQMQFRYVEKHHIYSMILFKFIYNQEIEIGNYNNQFIINKRSNLKLLKQFNHSRWNLSTTISSNSSYCSFVHMYIHYQILLSK